MDQPDFAHGFRPTKAGFHGLVKVFQSLFESALLNEQLDQALQNRAPAFVFVQKS